MTPSKIKRLLHSIPQTTAVTACTNMTPFVLRSSWQMDFLGVNMFSFIITCCLFLFGIIKLWSHHTDAKQEWKHQSMSYSCAWLYLLVFFVTNRFILKAIQIFIFNATFTFSQPLILSKHVFVKLCEEENAKAEVCLSHTGFALRSAEQRDGRATGHVGRCVELSGIGWLLFLPIRAIVLFVNHFCFERLLPFIAPRARIFSVNIAD